MTLFGFFFLVFVVYVCACARMILLIKLHGLDD
jgi:hypothetical protein